MSHSWRPPLMTKSEVAPIASAPIALNALRILCVTTALIVSSVVRADCQWPPLDVIEERDSHTEVIRGVPFTSSYRSWHVPSYQIDRFRCETTISIGPRHWSLIIGPEGDMTPIEEKAQNKAMQNKATEESPKSQSTHLQSTLKTSPRLQTPPALPPLTLPPLTQSSLPPLPRWENTLPAPPSLDDLPVPPPLSGIQQLSLPALPSLPALSHSQREH